MKGERELSRNAREYLKMDRDSQLVEEGDEHIRESEEGGKSVVRDWII